MSKRRSVWPKGLPRKGFKDSGMTLAEWAELKGFDLKTGTPAPAEPKLKKPKRGRREAYDDADGPQVVRGKIQFEGKEYRWKMKKDSWARQIISVFDDIGDKILEEQRKYLSMDKQVGIMLKEMKDAQNDNKQEVSREGVHA